MDNPMENCNLIKIFIALFNNHSWGEIVGIYSYLLRIVLSFDFSHRIAQ